jgi:hypothetical protein
MMAPVFEIGGIQRLLGISALISYLREMKRLLTFS